LVVKEVVMGLRREIDVEASPEEVTESAPSFPLAGFALSFTRVLA
jgi:hypothetical protein